MKSGILGFLLAVLAGIVASIIGYLLWQLITRIRLSEGVKKSIRYGFLFILAGTVAIPVYYGGLSWSKASPFSTTQFIIALCALLAQLVTVGYLLYRVAYREAQVQYGRPFRAWIGHGEKPNHVLPVRCLDTTGLQPGDRLYANWKTFTDGVEFLVDQVNGFSPAFNPQLYVGINHAGGALAALLAGALGGGTTPVAFISTKGDPDHSVTQTIPPQTSGQPKMILVADGEVKRGKSAKNVIDFLKEKYPEARIKFAVLIASQVRLPIENITDLTRDRRGVFEENEQYLPDFIAFVSHIPVRLTDHQIQ